MYGIEDFMKLLREMIRFFTDITMVEKEKLQAAIDNNILTTENCMKKEQVYILKFRGMEKKRDAILSELSLKNKSLREILELVDDKHKEEFAKIYMELNEAVKQYRSAFDSTKDMIEINLHKINKTLTDLETKKDGKTGAVYTQNGHLHSSSGSAHFTNRKI